MEGKHFKSPSVRVLSQEKHFCKHQSVSLPFCKLPEKVKASVNGTKKKKKCIYIYILRSVLLVALNIMTKQENFAAREGLDG